MTPRSGSRSGSRTVDFFCVSVLISLQCTETAILRQTARQACYSADLLASQNPVDETRSGRPLAEYGRAMAGEAIVVRNVSGEDFERWAELYRGYRDFYALPSDEQVIERVWGWLLDDSIEVQGLLAQHEGGIVGLAHWRRFYRPSSGTVGIYLDDLFTDPAHRGAGVGRALLTSLGSQAAVDGCAVVRWITAEDNATARGLYDQVARATPWVTYDLSPTA